MKIQMPKSPVKRKVVAKKKPAKQVKTVDKSKKANAPKLSPMRKSVKIWNRDKVMGYIYPQIANTTSSIETILKSAPYEMPCRQLITAWITETEEYQVNIARAREDRAEVMAEQIIEIADNIGSPAMVDGEVVIVKGEVVMAVDPAEVSKAKLQCDNLKWLMGYLKPKKFGNPQNDPNGAGRLQPAGSTTTINVTFVSANAEEIEARRTPKAPIIDLSADQVRVVKVG